MRMPEMHKRASGVYDFCLKKMTRSKRILTMMTTGKRILMMMTLIDGCLFTALHGPSSLEIALQS
ncbi:MAG: hypothetical protein ACRECH_08565 [Nitrososphaerales archaeon]